MPPIAYFGIESKTLSLVIDLLILFVVVLYGSLVYWTYTDARRRIVDPMLIGCATAASLFPFVGTIVYLILRPPEYLEDARERELDIQATEARLHELDYSLCPHCDYRIERDFIRCPSCLRKLKERCASCSKPLDRAWTICPYCEAEVQPAKPARRTRRERVQTEDSEASLSRTTLENEPTPATSSAESRAASRSRARAAERDRTAVRAAEPSPRATPEPASEQAPSESVATPSPRTRGTTRPRPTT